MSIRDFGRLVVDGLLGEKSVQAIQEEIKKENKRGNNQP